MAVNWFKEAELNRRPVQLGRLQHLDEIRLQPTDVQTHFVDVNSTNEASSICSIPGIWEPAEGTLIRLHEPDRIAKVSSVALLFDASGFSATVWIEDPLTAPKTGREL